MTKRYCDICEKVIGRQTNYTKVKILPQIKINKFETPFTENETLDLCMDCMKKLRKSVYSIKQACKLGYR